MFFVSLLLSLFAANPAPTGSTLKVAVLYCTAIDKDLKASLTRNIESTYRCEVMEIKEQAALPAAAWYKPRNRYRAPVLLDWLKNMDLGDKIIGITAKDISTSSNGVYDWGVLGLGQCPGKSCVISTYRMKTPNKKLFEDRLIKVALHELGHTMGLPHCESSQSCFMADASGSIKTVDRESRSLCTKCKKRIAHYIPA